MRYDVGNQSPCLDHMHTHTHTCRGVKVGSWDPYQTNHTRDGIHKYPDVQNNKYKWLKPL